MVNQIDDRTLAHALIDDLAAQMEATGQWAVVIATPDAANLNSWRRLAEARALESYPDLKLVDTVYTEENENLARQRVETLLNKHPGLKGIIAFDSNSVPGAADAIERAGKVGQVALVGNTTPGKMKGFLERGVLKSFYLWDPRELGALTIKLATMLVRGQEVAPGVEVPGHGPLRFSDHDPKMVIMAEPIRFTRENIDQYDWGF
jgi:ABC-type sugar transport system substrate-binding protein